MLIKYINLFFMLVSIAACTSCAGAMDITQYLDARKPSIFTAAPDGSCMVSTNLRFRVHLSSITTNTPYFLMFSENLARGPIGRTYPENAVLLSPGVPVIAIGNSTPSINESKVTYEGLASIISKYDEDVSEKFQTGKSFQNSGNLIIIMEDGTTLENFDTALSYLKPTLGWRNLIFVVSISSGKGVR